MYPQIVKTRFSQKSDPSPKRAATAADSISDTYTEN